MDAHDLRLREIAKAMRASQSSDIDDIEQQRFDAASVIRAAIEDNALRIPDLAGSLVDVNWHVFVFDIPHHKALNFFSRVAQWCYHQYRNGLFPAGSVRNEVVDYATVCDLIADLIERDDASFLIDADSVIQDFTECVEIYCSVPHSSSIGVHISLWQLHSYGLLTPAMRTLHSDFAYEDHDGRRATAVNALQKLASVLSLEIGKSDDNIGKSRTQPNAHQPARKLAPIRENGNAERKIRKWDEQCGTILRRWIRAMDESNKWIPLKTFLDNDLPRLQHESPATWKELTVRRFTQKFADNKDEWEWQVLQWKKPK